MKMTGIIFSNIYDSHMGSLTSQRTAASVPFGGRYRFVDFVLSNMVNSGVCSIGVITKHNYESLMEHLGGGSEWDLNRKNASLYILPPFATGITNVYRGNLEALCNALSFLEGEKPDYVLMCDTTVICNIDFGDALASHIGSGADVTVICNRTIEEFERDKNDLVLCAKEGSVCDLAIGYMLPESPLVGMGMYIIERKKLTDIIRSQTARGRYSFEKDYLLPCFASGEAKINAFEFCGTVLRNHNIVSYFKNNFRLMEESINSDIFKRDAVIKTKVRDEAPTRYGADSAVLNCLVADGCVIKGRVENSVLFRGVVVDEGASVRNSIVMQGSRIEKGASVSYAIIDKNAHISGSAALSGAPYVPIVINKEEKV